MIGSNGVVFSVARVDSAWRRRVGSVVRKPASCRVNKHNLEGLAVVWRGLPCLAELPYSAGHARVVWVCRSGGVWNTWLDRCGSWVEHGDCSASAGVVKGSEDIPTTNVDAVRPHEKGIARSTNKRPPRLLILSSLCGFGTHIAYMYLLTCCAPERGTPRRRETGASTSSLPGQPQNHNSPSLPHNILGFGGNSFSFPFALPGGRATITALVCCIAGAWLLQDILTKLTPSPWLM